MPLMRSAFLLLCVLSRESELCPNPIVYIVLYYKCFMHTNKHPNFVHKALLSFEEAPFLYFTHIN